MKAGQKLWTREELILAINLYCKIPFGSIHNRNPQVVRLAELIGRSPNSVSYKLVNFASLDPIQQARGIKGAKNVSKLDREIWNEFSEDWELLPFQSEQLRAKFEYSTIEKINQIEESDLPKEGKVREQIVKTRVNQSFFRAAILAAYNSTCCITGLQNPELLIASHIRPWGLDEKNRLNPRNGLAINALHDKAFENGLLTITTDYKIKISPLLEVDKKSPVINDFFIKYNGQQINLPSRFLPDAEFLKYHNNERFRS